MLDKQARSFAKTCIDRGMTVLSTNAFREKAKLIAKQKQLDCYDDTEALQQIINDYIAEDNAQREAADKKRLDDRKKKEQREKESLERYADDVGRDKPIHYYDDKIAEIQCTISIREDAMESAKTVTHAFNALADSVQTRKSPPPQDWAIAGGIASAIAGPAAGIAVASDIQRQNSESRIDPVEAAKEAAEVKQYHRATGRSYAQEILDGCNVSVEEYRFALQQRSELLQTKEKYEVLLLDDTIDQYQLLGMLNPSVKSIQVSESGSVHVSVQVEGRYYSIFDDVPAVIDGSFRALLWNKKGDCCGTAALVLPVDGAKRDMVLNAWFTQPKSQDDHYTIEITAPNLWMVEALVEPKHDNLSSITPSKKDYSPKPQTFYDAYLLRDSTELDDLRKAIELFDSLGNWKDAPKQKQRCIDILQDAEEKERQEAERLERERLQREEQLRAEQEIIRLEEEKKQEQRQKIKYILFNWVPQFVSILLALILIILLITNVIIPSSKYKKALKLGENGEYDNAIAVLTELDDYKDSKEQILNMRYNTASTFEKDGDTDKAIEAYTALGEFKDSKDRMLELSYNKAVSLAENGLHSEAGELFETLGYYKDSKLQSLYQMALSYNESGDYPKAIYLFEQLGDFGDSAQRLSEVQEKKTESDYQTAMTYINGSKIAEAYALLTQLGDYKDSKTHLGRIHYLPVSVKEIGPSVTNEYSLKYDDSGKINHIDFINQNWSYDIIKYDSKGNVLEYNKKMRSLEYNYTIEYKEDGSASKLHKEKTINGNYDMYITELYDKYGNRTRYESRTDYTTVDDLVSITTYQYTLDKHGMPTVKKPHVILEYTEVDQSPTNYKGITYTDEKEYLLSYSFDNTKVTIDYNYLYCKSGSVPDATIVVENLKRIGILYI